jgi:nucleotide-binding universal stress UspA family protein
MKTKEIKKVLIALDYDKSTKKIAKQGFDLALAMHAEIILLHVISEEAVIYSDYSHIHELEFDYKQDIEELTQNYLDKSSAKLEDESIKSIVEKGNISTIILEISKNLKVDVIVMGSHSRKWMANMIMGSKAKEVLKETKIPLFIVPTEYAI